MKCAQSGSSVFHADVIDSPLRDRINVHTNYGVLLDIDVTYADEHKSAIVDSFVTNGQGSKCGPVSIVSDDILDVVGFDEHYLLPKQTSYVIDLVREVIEEQGGYGDLIKGTVAVSAVSESCDDIAVSTKLFNMDIRVQYTDSTKVAVDSISYDESVAVIESFAIVEDGFSFKMQHSNYEIPKETTYRIMRSSCDVIELDGPDSGVAEFLFVPFVSASDASYEAVGALLEKGIFPDVILSFVNGDTSLLFRALFAYSETGPVPEECYHLFASGDLKAQLLADGRFEIL